MTYTVFQRKGVNNAWEKIIFHPFIFKIKTISLNTFLEFFFHFSYGYKEPLNLSRLPPTFYD